MSDISSKPFPQRDREILKKLKVGSFHHKVYVYMRDTSSLTVQDCIKMWNRYNLAQVVSRLRKYGAIIENINYDNKELNYARYKLVK